MASVFHSNVFKRKFLLVYGCRSKQCCFNAFLKPRWGDVTGITHLLNGLDLVATTLCLTITDGNICLDNLTFFQYIGVGNLFRGVLLIHKFECKPFRKSRSFGISRPS